jgi:hypothetical protein
MADRVLFVGWSNPVRGREERALEVFNESVGLYGRMQQDGRIEGFEIMLFGSNPTINGFAVLRGDDAQIHAVEDDEEFRRVIIDASLIVEGLTVMPGYANAGVAQQMAMYSEAIGKVPQMA